MKIGGEEYKDYAQRHSPRSKMGRNMWRAFFVGGAICALGQLIQNCFALCELDAQSAATASSVTLIFLGALLTGLGVYDDLARFAGAGTLVPITGFANSVVAPALEFKTDEGVIIRTVRKSPISG